MIKSLLLLTVLTALSASATVALAEDTDPGYGSMAPRLKMGGLPPGNAFKPTQRYYGKGFTVDYGYIKTTKTTRPLGTAFERATVEVADPRVSIWSIKGEPRRTSAFVPTYTPLPKVPSFSAPIPATGIVKEQTVPTLPPVGEAPKK